jgi:hypothetical protein
MAHLEADQVEWDVERYSDHTKNSRPTTSEQISSADQQLEKYFPKAHWGRSDEPGVLIDCQGRILVWHLPGILSRARVVRNQYLRDSRTDLIYLCELGTHQQLDIGPEAAYQYKPTQTRQTCCERGTNPLALPSVQRFLRVPHIWCRQGSSITRLFYATERSRSLRTYYLHYLQYLMSVYSG